METRTVDDLVRRLNRIERETRRLKLIGVAGLIALFAVTLMGQAGPGKIVEAEKFVIRDANGRVRGILGIGVVLAEGKESVGLRLLDELGKTRSQFFLRADGAPFVQLRDREEKISAQLDLSGDNIPGLGLYGKRSGLGAPRAEVVLSFQKDGSPFVHLIDKNGKVFWKAP